MAEDPVPRPPSSVVPVLVAVLTCDVAVVDPASGKKSLIGIFDKIFARQFPMARPLAIYVRLADAQGYYRLLLKLVHLETGIVMAETRAEFEMTDRLGSIDGIIPAVVNFPFPHRGRYELQVHANDVFLGSATIDVEPMPQEGTL